MPHPGMKVEMKSKYLGKVVNMSHLRDTTYRESSNNTSHENSFAGELKPTVTTATN